MTKYVNIIPLPISNTQQRRGTNYKGKSNPVKKNLASVCSFAYRIRLVGFSMFFFARVRICVALRNIIFLCIYLHENCCWFFRFIFHLLVPKARSKLLVDFISRLLPSLREFRVQLELWLYTNDCDILYIPQQILYRNLAARRLKSR